MILADFVAKDAKTNIGGLRIRGEKAIPGIDEMVGVGRIELPTSCSQSRRPTAGLHPVVSEFTMSIEVESLRPEWARAYLDPSPGPTSEG